MGFSVDDSIVRGDLFTENGKWKYTVALDYTKTDYHNWDLWEEARNALRDATHNGISGVTLTDIPEGWSLVILEPYAANGYPITVRSK